MGLLSKMFGIGKSDPMELSREVGNLINEVSAKECAKLQKFWETSLDEQTETILFCEYAIILLSITDRLGLKQWGESPTRELVLNALMREVKNAFCQQPMFGDDAAARSRYFEDIFQTRYRNYSSCKEIFGKDTDNLISRAADTLVANFLKDTPEAQKASVALNTAESISQMLLAIMTSPALINLYPEGRLELSKRMP